MWHDGSRESKRNLFQERLAAHWTNLNSMKWMLWNDGVDMAEFGMTRVREFGITPPNSKNSATMARAPPRSEWRERQRAADRHPKPALNQNLFAEGIEDPGGVSESRWHNGSFVSHRSAFFYPNNH